MLGLPEARSNLAVIVCISPSVDRRFCTKSQDLECLVKPCPCIDGRAYYGIGIRTRGLSLRRENTLIASSQYSTSGSLQHD